jgi:hypothetical protein
LTEICDFEKWHPVTFAILNGNTEVIKYLINTSLCNTKKLLKVPGLYDTQLLNRLFPLIISLSPTENSAWNQDMFGYFWDDLGGFLWNEDSFEALLKLVIKRELLDLIPILFRSRTTHSIFAAMSYHYRFSFIEHLLQLRNDTLDELQSVFTNVVNRVSHDRTIEEGDEGLDPSEVEEFLYERRAAITNTFEKIYEALSE